MIKFQEARSLIPVKCYYNVDMNCYVFKFGGKTISVKGIADEVLAKIFRTCQMKDEETEPRSARGKTYMEMVDAIKNGTDHINYIWTTYENTLVQELENYTNSSKVY